MIKVFYIIVSLFFFILSVYFIYNARNIISKRVSNENKNMAVKGLKIVGYVMCVISLILISYLKNNI